MILYCIIVTLGIFIDDLSTIFDLIGAFGFSFSAFLLPAIFYLLMTSDRSEGSLAFNLTYQSKTTIRVNRIGSYFLILLGAANMILVIAKTIDNDHSEE